MAVARLELIKVCVIKAESNVYDSAFYNDFKFWRNKFGWG